MDTGLWNMDSGLTAARRPGMTTVERARVIRIAAESAPAFAEPTSVGEE